MAQYYVDPNAGDDNNGTGAIGSPWKSIQKALNTISAASGGDRINLKAGTADTLTATLTTSYATNYDKPLTIQGYTSTAGDGGKGVINGAGTYAIMGSKAYVAWRDLHLTNTGSAVILTLNAGCNVFDCEFSESTGTAVQTGHHASVSGCNFHDIGGSGVYINGSDNNIIGNYFKNGATKKFTSSAIYTDYPGASIRRNIFSLDGASGGIIQDAVSADCSNNSILSVSGTSQAILVGKTGSRNEANLVSGFNGTGGIGIKGPNAAWMSSYKGRNGVHLCTEAYWEVGEYYAKQEDNETLAVCPFAKSGSDTFANRLAYFAPVGTGNVLGGGGYGEVDKGAVQSAGGGGGTYTAASNVRYGTDRGDGTTGTCYVPAAADVQFGVNVDATTGTFVSPDPSDVRNTTEYGAAAEFTGTMLEGADWTAVERQQIRYQLKMDGSAADPGNGMIEANVAQIGASATALAALKASLDGCVASTVNDAAAAANSFVTALASTVNDYYNGAYLLFASGALAGQARKITDYDGSTKTVTLDANLTSAPANGVSFVILGRAGS